MAAQKGRDFLLYIGAAGSGTLVADMRSTSFRRAGETVDVTTKDSAGARTLLAAGGSYSVSLSGTGVVSDNDQTATLDGYVKARSIQAMGIVWADGDKIDGNFQVTQFEAAGEHNGEQTWNITLESSGATTETVA